LAQVPKPQPSLALWLPNARRLATTAGDRRRLKACR